MNRYISSDLHFYHKNILKHHPDMRPFESVDEMNLALIAYINTILFHKNSHLYILGDLVLGNRNQVREILSLLPCDQITLIPGNHDKEFISIYEEHFAEVTWYKEISSERTKVCMMHFPIESWNRKHRGSIMLHGHLHSKNHVTGTRRRDVGFDAHGHILDLDEYVKSILSDDLPTEDHHGNAI